MESLETPAVPVRSGRTAGAPAKFWHVWWSQTSRHPDDVWPALPKELRRARTTMSLIQLSFFAVLAVLVVGWGQLLTTGGFSGAIAVLIGAVGVVGTVWKVATKWEMRGVTTLLEQRGLSHVSVDKLLTESTIGNEYWQGDDVSRLLAPTAHDK